MFFDQAKVFETNMIIYLGEIQINYPITSLIKIFEIEALSI